MTTRPASAHDFGISFWVSPNQPVGARPSVRGSEGADVGILCRDAVGREPEPTLVFCAALPPEGCGKVGELEMIDISMLPSFRDTNCMMRHAVAEIYGFVKRSIVRIRSHQPFSLARVIRMTSPPLRG